MKRTSHILLVASITLVVLSSQATYGQLKVRIKDIADVQGVRTNRLTGFGLVTGLQGTGGTSPVTRQFAQNLLENFGLRADPLVRAAIRTDTQNRTDNLSVVSVTARLPSFQKPGSKIDVIVAAFDDAESLQGGTLIATPLVGLDGEVYAIASGPLSVGGFSFSGDAGSVQKNHPTTGRISNGADVEKEVCAPPIGLRGNVRLNLRKHDYETCRRITNVINAEWPNAAHAVDPSTVNVRVPLQFVRNVSPFIGLMTSLKVTPDSAARVVINSRTGTVVVGSNVKISQVAITHANLAVVTGESPEVSQPAPFSQGQTTVVPRTQIDVVEEDSRVNVFENTATVGDLAKALNSLGVTPRDLSAIFQQLKEAGALHADLIMN